MPTYVYKFIDTGETIEIHQAFSDEPLTEAPHPSDGRPRPVKKVFMPVGVTFKGGGFYKTDSRGSSSGSSSTSTSASSGASSGDSSSGSAASTSTASTSTSSASSGSSSSGSSD